jgi:hypothetical protein
MVILTASPNYVGFILTRSRACLAAHPDDFYGTSVSRNFYWLTLCCRRLLVRVPPFVVPRSCGGA